MKQTLAVTWMNLRSLPSRYMTSLVVVVGIALVVGVLVAMLSMSKGFEHTLKGTGSESRALMLSAGVTAELSSYIDPQMVPLLREMPGIRRDAAGKPLASAELLVITELRRGDGDVNVALRGVEPAGMTIRPEVKLVEGRLFKSGLRELIAGRSATRQFSGINVGSKLQFRGSEWDVVGIFESDGDAHESELWTDADTARSAFGRPGASAILAQFDTSTPPAVALQTLKAAVAADPRFQIDVLGERDYYSSQSQGVTDNINFITVFITVIMAFGAVFGALNTMYSAVAARQIEIATLRAIGFSGLPVMVSVLAESVALALIGGLIGAGCAWLLFDGLTTATLGQNFTQVAFSFAVTPALVARGLSWALGIGLIGGFFPALKAIRQPVAEALRGA
ncbi:ABC transporter permease [Nevskia soli]|uniref:ABC transporter permease n=1 Tax=Nevskia soli TaxID=418856 RepID=UPI000A026BB2|nr:ABC transporter permease [Nevskia soli]